MIGSYGDEKRAVGETMTTGLQLEAISARMAGVAAWLDQTASDHLADHRHLDHQSAESAYWHSGYHQALADILQSLSARNE
jgi:hypothetical protein